MHSRVAELTQSHNTLQQSSQKIIQSLSKDKHIPWIKDMIDVIAAENKYDDEEFRMLLPLEIFAGEYYEIHNLLDQLDEDFEAWENAIKENKGKGLSAFLDAADPITDNMKLHLKALVDKRKEQISRNLHLLPTGFNECYQALYQKHLEISAMLEKIPAPSSKSDPAYPLLWNHRHLYEEKRIARLNIKKEFWEKCSKENLGSTIKSYQLQVAELFEVYDKLVDEEGAEIPDNLTQAAATATLQGERQTQRAAPITLDKPAEKINLEALSSLMGAEKKAVTSSRDSASVKSDSANLSDSPPRSNSNTPLRDSELSRSSLSGSDDEARPVVSSLAGLSVTQDVKATPLEHKATQLLSSPTVKNQPQPAAPAFVLPPSPQAASTRQEEAPKGLLAKLGLNKPPASTSSANAQANVKKLTAALR